MDNVIIFDNSDDFEIANKLKIIISNLNKNNINFEKFCIYMTNSTNVGISKAYNLSVEKALEFGFEFILFLDQDSYVSKHELGKLFAKYTELSNSIKEVGA